MRLILYIISSFLFIQCSTLKPNCVENNEFKIIFMSHINEVENYTLGKGERRKYDEGLKFLSKYVKISYEETMNYNNSYTNYNVFQKDKNNWLKWYEENKCKNIQIR